MQKIEGPTLTVKIPSEDVAKLDRIAKRHGLSRNKTLRMLLDIGVGTYETYEMIGVPQLAELSKKTKKTLKEAIQPKLV